MMENIRIKKPNNLGEKEWEKKTWVERPRGKIHKTQNTEGTRTMQEMTQFVKVWGERRGGKYRVVNKAKVELNQGRKDSGQEKTGKKTAVTSQGGKFR